jgi:hypothetical protein
MQADILLVIASTIMKQLPFSIQLHCGPPPLPHYHVYLRRIFPAPPPTVPVPSWMRLHWQVKRTWAASYSAKRTVGVTSGVPQGTDWGAAWLGTGGANAEGRKLRQRS